MHQHRFFISPAAIGSDRVLLTGTMVHQLRDVLRMQPEITAGPGAG